MRTVPTEWTNAIAAFFAKYDHRNSLRKKGFANWQQALEFAWQSGKDVLEPEGHYLRQVRNTLGPDWLLEHYPVPAPRSKPAVGIQTEPDRASNIVGRAQMPSQTKPIRGGEKCAHSEHRSQLASRSRVKSNGNRASL